MHRLARTLRNVIANRWQLLVCLAIPQLVVPQCANAALPIEHWLTSSGVSVYFMRADAIPMLDIEVRFDAGERLDKFAKIGVAGMVANLLDTGAGEMDETQLASAFAQIGARRSSWASDDSASVRLRTLLTKPELDQALDLMRTVMARPRFDESVLKREIARTAQSIREGDNRAGTIAAREFYQLAYQGHPYGYRSTEQTLAALTPEDLNAFHKKYYVRARATIAMIGAIERSTAQVIAERLLADLPAGQAASDAIEAVPELTKARQQLIPHPGAQSHIYVGKPFIARGDPDYFALMVANSVLGGASFVSRLYKEVREKRGLVYSVSSNFSLKKQPGLFAITLQTRREKTAQALAVVGDVLKDFVTKGVSAKELEAARSNLTGGFVFRIDSNSKILGLMSAIGYHKLDLDYLDKWTERVNAVTLEQVNDAVKRRLDPSKMITVVAGAIDNLTDVQPK